MSVITKKKHYNNTIWYYAETPETFGITGYPTTDLKVGDFIMHVGHTDVYVVTKIWNNPRFVDSPICIKARIHKGVNQNTKFEVIRKDVELINYRKVLKS